MNPFASLFSRKPEPLFGLDITSSSVKLVELSHTEGAGYTVEHCALESLEPGCIIDGSIQKFDEVVEAVERAVKRSGVKTKNVAMALPASAVITKRIVLPKGLTEREMEVQVETEANQYIPFALDEVSLDFCVIGPNANSVDDQDVLIAATRKEKVEEIQNLAEAAGLKPLVLDIESYAARSVALDHIQRLPNGGQDLVVALIEIGALSASMQVMQNGNVLYERDQMFGGAQLTQLIVRHYGFSVEEAEQKKRSGDLPDDFATAVLPQFVQAAAQDIVRAIQFFYTSTPFNSIDCVLLGGGGSNAEGLVDAVSAQASTVCQLLDPFEGMKLSSQIKDKQVRKGNTLSYLGACGLAMRRFTL